MIIKNLFKKDINRNIETVIKADDRDHISDEVAEYVITNEITTKIRDFFQAYNDYAGANGVWISGFFGSGKSHLLKILSYVLENKEFDGYESGALFAEKIENDEMLKADVIAATRIPSESILYNIDQQENKINKSDPNAILSVFYKVFYDHLGYYGFQSHVAEFEMWLDQKGQYDTFKEKFSNKHGKAWVEVRRNYFDPLVTDDIAAVLAEINKTDASKYENILETLEDREKQSIEDFAERVEEYIQSKPKGFRLNFFVDEVGQYISENTKLMLNLQTIAETLATRTRGNSWIIVTSQDDMEKVVGDMNASQQNDFSRIQARFKIKIPLTSANVDEVIEKRLLKKNEKGEKDLIIAYKKEHAHLDTLLSFSDAGVQFRGYKGEKDFASKFPFVPYQFDLFQQCRKALSKHNAFQGKHASVGERSMLGVFQQVIQNIEDDNEKKIVSFDMMFAGIRNELVTEVQNSIILAEKNLDNLFAIEVLKALFLVKYYDSFKTTKRNISVLMINDVDVDIKAHEQKIEEALNTLENQSYVQRNGDIYEFLTDDEKDVEQEIKATNIDEQAVTGLLKEIFFDEIIRDNKIRFLENKQDYDFTSKIDGNVLGREKELAIEIITDNFPDYSNEAIIKTQTMGTTSMRMLLSSDAVFMKDLKMYLRTDKYIKQKQSSSNRSELKRIHQEKAQQNAERKRNLKMLGNKSLASSKVFINGALHEMSHTNDGKTRVINGFQDLIKTVYSNLRMLGTTHFTEDSVKSVINSPQDDLFGTDDTTLSEAESEILNYISRRKKQSERTSLNDLKTHFTRRPSGWYPNAIWTMVAKLYKRGKIEVKQDSNLLDDREVLNNLLNSSYHINTLLEPQAVIDPKLVKELKNVYKEAFDESCSEKEAKAVANAFKDKLKDMNNEVNILLAQKHEYPFLRILDDFSDKLDNLCKKEYSYYLTSKNEFEDDLLDAKEDVLDPVKRFMNGDQLSIYNDIKNLLNRDTSNLEYIEGEELNSLKALLKNEQPYQGNLIKEAKSSMDTLRKLVGARIKEEKEEAITLIENAIKDLQSKDEFKKLDEDKQEVIIQPFNDELGKLKNQNFIARIRDIKNNVEDVLFERQLNEMIRLATPVNEVGGKTIEEPRPHYIRQSSIKIKYSKTELQTEEDVDNYVDELRKEWKEQIKNNRRIAL